MKAKRYAELGRLLYRYGRADLVQAAGLQAPEDAAATAAGARRDRRGSAARQTLEEGYRHAVAEGLVEERRAAERDGQTHAELDASERGRRLARDLERMGPAYVKLGQLLSTRPDLLPIEYLDPLARLQDRIEPVAFDEIERIVTRELGVRISKAFRSFDPTPLGSASLGQVHRATLRDGRAVAVKVQRPGIWDRIREDLEVMDEVASMLQSHSDFGERYRPADVVEELRATLLRELDYRTEARNLEVLGSNLADFDEIVVPAPVEDYTTSRVLTMDYVRGRKVTALSPLARLDIEGERLADALFRAYLRQILVDGFFHADPHPGNLFITEDGRLALLDLGMVAHLGDDVQEKLLRLLLAVSEGAGEDAASVLEELAEGAADEPRAFRREIAALVTRTRTAEPERVQAGSVFLWISRLAAEHGLRAPPELTMLGKTLLNLDQVGRTLDPAFDPNAAIRRHAADVLRRRMLRRLSPGEIFSTSLEVAEFAQRLPARMNRLLDTIANNRLQVRVQSIDEERLIGGIQKIANRITVGLIVAALIVGAAMLMRVETDFTILGYPGLAILFFLVAAAGGLALVVSILRSG